MVLILVVSVPRRAFMSFLPRMLAAARALEATDGVSVPRRAFISFLPSPLFPYLLWPTVSVPRRAFIPFLCYERA